MPLQAQPCGDSTPDCCSQEYRFPLTPQLLVRRLGLQWFSSYPQLTNAEAKSLASAAKRWGLSFSIHPGMWAFPWVQHTENTGAQTAFPPSFEMMV